MKILVILAHPNIENSRVNRKWKERLLKEENITVIDLYELYRNKEFDVELEQKRLLEHDRIVFQFPIYWFSSPPLLKKYEDDILTYGFAYGESGDKLNGKEFLLAVSAGGEEKRYTRHSDFNYTIDEILVPFRATSDFTNMKFLPTFVIYDAGLVDEQNINSSAEEYIKHINKNFN